MPLLSSLPPDLLGEAAPADLQGVDQPPASQTPQSSGERSGSLGGGAAPKTKPRRRGGKKRGKATVDDLDTLQIRGRVGALLTELLRRCAACKHGNHSPETPPCHSPPSARVDPCRPARTLATSPCLPD